MLCMKLFVRMAVFEFAQILLLYIKVNVLMALNNGIYDPLYIEECFSNAKTCTLGEVLHCLLQGQIFQYKIIDFTKERPVYIGYNNIVLGKNKHLEITHSACVLHLKFLIACLASNLLVVVTMV